MTVRELLQELGGLVCRCGRRKGARKTFCPTCFARLPRDLQRPLYRRIGEGYEEAYEAAAAVVDRHKAEDDAKIARLTAR